MEKAQKYLKLGSIHRDAGHFQEVEKNWTKALELFKHEMEATNPAVYQLSANLGILYKEMGRFDEALRVLQGCLECCPNPNRADTATILGNLGVVCNDMGMHDMAIEYFQKAKEAWTVVNGAKSYNVAMTLCNIGDVYMQTDRVDEAQKFITEAVEIESQVVHPWTLIFVYGSMLTHAFLQVSKQEGWPTASFTMTLATAKLKLKELEEAMKLFQVRFHVPCLKI